MIRRGALLRLGAPALAALTAAVAATAFLATAGAASDLRVTAVDCQGHPRKIAVHNFGDAQDLTGWKLESDKPSEVFDLSIAGTLGSGKDLYVFNGHQAPAAPEQVGDSWIYPWNYTPVYDPAFFVLWEDGQDFIQIVDASGNVVSNKACPLPPATSTPQATPTPGPQATQPPGGGTTPDNTETGGGAQVSSGPGTQGTGGTGTAGEVFGPPAPGQQAPLPESGGPPLPQETLPLALIGMLAGSAAVLGGLIMMGLALRRSGPNT